MNRRSDFPDKTVVLPALRRAVACARVRTVWLGWALSLCAAWPASVQGAVSLEDWRARAAEVRTLAESDAPAAYTEALRMRDAVPPEATPADRVRLLNLLARVEIYLAQTERSAEHTREAFELRRATATSSGRPRPTSTPR